MEKRKQKASPDKAKKPNGHGPAAETPTQAPAPQAPAVETPIEVVEPMTAIGIPIRLFRAALACAAKKEKPKKSDGGHEINVLENIFVHAVGRQVRVVGCDRARLLVAAHEPNRAELPKWLTTGVMITTELLKERLTILEKGDDNLMLSYGAKASAIEMGDPADTTRFRLWPMPGDYLNYTTVIETAVGAFSPDGEAKDFQQVGFNAAHLKNVGDIAKVLDADVVSAFGQSTTAPSVFTFPSAPGIVLYVMPLGQTQVMKPPAATLALLAPAVKGTLAALKAHMTRNVEAAKAATSPQDKAALERKVDEYQARIKAVLADYQPALPKPEAKQPEPTEKPNGNGKQPAKGTRAAARVAPPKGKPQLMKKAAAAH